MSSSTILPAVDNTEQLNSLLDFLNDNNPQVRQLALVHLLGYTTKTSQFQHIFKQNDFKPIEELKNICTSCKGNPLIAHDSFKALVNLTSDEEICKKLNDDNFLQFMIKMILDRDSILADMICMLLSNITRNERISAKILLLDLLDQQQLEQSNNEKKKKPIDQLVDVFVNGVNRSYNKEAEFHFLANVFANITMLPQGREYFMIDSLYENENITPLSKVIIFTEHPNIIRRGGIDSCIKNCCFSTNHHFELLSESKINLLPYILLPLCGPEEFDLDDMEGMPDEIQLLPSDKKRESDVQLRKILLESLVLLTSTRKGREILRKKNVYPVIRQMHLVEKDDTILMDTIDQLVNMLMRDERNDQGNDKEENDDNDIVEISSSNNSDIKVLFPYTINSQFTQFI
ncbi:4184_t:CDS:10 [Diversispora eburnea]|uniref:Protein HGH1 homolog n=1 Tax=Diversispora eburnea TaxID=1213867 RepID=A0A9N9FR36_9GLOM|nr:4184_t:CDS:10 [Diversispora eburnea]